MANNNGGPAFPAEGQTRSGQFDSSGMTLRDYFAAKALTMLRGELNEEWLAERAYEIADAMLRAREKSNGQ